ncbi:hypothetical protein ACN47E_003598 [Coniothyrium glycines]
MLDKWAYDLRLAVNIKNEEKALKKRCEAGDEEDMEKLYLDAMAVENILQLSNLPSGSRQRVVAAAKRRHDKALRSKNMSLGHAPLTTLGNTISGDQSYDSQDFSASLAPTYSDQLWNSDQLWKW